MKVVIIGSGSFLATYVNDTFVDDEGVELLLFGRVKPAIPSSAQFMYFSYPDKLFQLKELLDSDLVIYCAAAGVQANKKFNTDLIYDLNAFFPIKIINFLNDNNYKGKWISFGSYFEIGNNDARHLYNENEIVASVLPIPNHYCSAKRLLTRYISNNQINIKYIHFILPTIYGVKEDANRLIPYIIASIKNNSELQLSSGNQVRQYIHGSDVASLLKLAAYSDCNSGIYNVSNEPPIKIADLVQNIFSLFGKSASSSFGTLSTRDENMKYLAIDREKISKAIPHWKPIVSMSKGILEYI